jgi:hypothetical protein
MNMITPNPEHAPVKEPPQPKPEPKEPPAPGPIDKPPAPPAPPPARFYVALLKSSSLFQKTGVGGRPRLFCTTDFGGAFIFCLTEMQILSDGNPRLRNTPI